jgi:hypothetical protein
VAVVVLKLKNKTNVLGKLFRGHFVLAIEFSYYVIFKSDRHEYVLLKFSAGTLCFTIVKDTYYFC